MRQKFTIFDLDNCLADDAWRIGLIDWEQADMDKRYDAYHRACGGDAARNVEYLTAAVEAGHVPVFITARPVTVWDITVNWLVRSFGVLTEPCTDLHRARKGEFILFMRNVGDHRRSCDMKEAALADLMDVNGWDILKSNLYHAYDDRHDVVAMYRRNGINASVLAIHDQCAMTPPPKAAPRIGAAAILDAGAQTFAERNAVYGSNYKMVAPMMKVLFPDGVPSNLPFDDAFHLFELILVKLSRFAISGLTHQDSIHDLMVYGAMIEAILKEKQQ